jgi:hypothetical protein
MDTTALNAITISDFLTGRGPRARTLHKNGKSYSLEIINELCFMGSGLRAELDGYNPRVIYEFYIDRKKNVSWSVHKADYEECDLDYDFLEELLCDFFPKGSELDIKQPEEE